jgi:hypothetical protein
MIEPTLSLPPNVVGAVRGEVLICVGQLSLEDSPSPTAVAQEYQVGAGCQCLVAQRCPLFMHIWKSEGDCLHICRCASNGGATGDLAHSCIWSWGNLRQMYDFQCAALQGTDQISAGSSNSSCETCSRSSVSALICAIHTRRHARLTTPQGN